MHQWIVGLENLFVCNKFENFWFEYQKQNEKKNLFELCQVKCLSTQCHANIRILFVNLIAFKAYEV